MEPYQCLTTFDYLFGCGAELPANDFAGNHTRSSAVGTSSLPVWTFVMLFSLYFMGFCGQIPGNVALYTKLTGPTNAGIYQSILQAVMAIGRVGSSELVGMAFETSGPCLLFATVLSLWLIQWVASCPTG